MINKGVIISNIHDQANKSQKTVVIMGVARSGTSMAAQVVKDLGIEMGGNKSSVYNERKDVYSLLEEDKIAEFDALVTQQNDQYDLWGWKRPRSVEYVDRFEERIRNPHYIIPFRDYVSIAVRNNMAINTDPQTNLIDTHVNRYSKVIEFVQQNEQPILLFSYEKAVIYPRYFVSQIAQFLGVSDSKNIEKAITSIDVGDNRYVKINKNLGNLDKVSNGKVHGWAKRATSASPLTLKLYVDGNYVKEIVANKPRKDLSQIGKHAFSDSFDEIGLVSGVSYQVSVCDQQGTPIKNSPKVYIHD